MKFRRSPVSSGGRIADLRRRPRRRYTLRELPSVLRTPLGRRWFVRHFLHRCWPALFRLAGLYRRTVLRKTHVVAVVGSYGKTTATRVITGVLGKKLHPRATANAISQIPYAVFRVRPWNDVAVIEAGVECQGQMTAIADVLRPNCAVVMSVGSEHHSSFGTLEVTRDEKANMVRALPETGVAVLNGDDPNVLWMASQTRARVVTFGFGETNQVRATDPQLDWPRGMRFRLHAGGEARPVRIRLIGRHMIYPALAAVAVALERGISMNEIISRLESVTQAPGRLSVHPLENGATILRDDAKSALETIHAALDVLEETPAQRKIVVFGPITEPPAHSRQFYRALGARVAKIAQLAVCVDSYKHYKPGLLEAGMPRESVVDAGADLTRVIDLLRSTLRPGDLMLIKGRSTQRLERITLALGGWRVACLIASCPARAAHCPICPMLERGWGALRVIA
jgi:UDP-N-acetylmuramoyl-tripeptide--D-alanyl-D-alanine ligase